MVFKENWEKGKVIKNEKKIVRRLGVPDDSTCSAKT